MTDQPRPAMTMREIREALGHVKPASSATADQPTVEKDAIHVHFGLSYANYLVLPRTLLQSMPDRWQTQFVALLDEMTAAFDHVPQAEAYKVEAAREYTVREMNDAELAEAGIEADWYGGETPPEGLPEDEFAEWRAEHEQDLPDYYQVGDGEEIDPDRRVLLAVPDPVPHYNRGRTYIQPKPPARSKGELCPFGEGDAPGSGWILPAGHEPANRHVVTPGDADLDL
jgi:hypothetical protein